jgi:hypothetical protein
MVMAEVRKLADQWTTGVTARKSTMAVPDQQVAILHAIWPKIRVPNFVNQAAGTAMESSSGPRSFWPTFAASLLDELARGRAQVFLLGELIADEQLDDAGLDEFLAKARTLADNWLSAVDR